MILIVLSDFKIGFFGHRFFYSGCKELNPLKGEVSLMKCKICGYALNSALDLGKTPLANSLVPNNSVSSQMFDLHLLRCGNCKNMQLSEFISADILYENYLYATPDSTMLSSHYDFLMQFLLNSSLIGKDSTSVEIGCNVGQFLERLTEVSKVAFGVDPAQNIVEVARSRGLNVHNEFFTEKTAVRLKEDYGQADLVVARHCFAHNEFPHEMIKAASEILSNDGAMVIENAYVLNTVMNGEFDQIYHEHMYYYSLSSLSALFRPYGFEIVDATIGMIHGGSIVAVAKRIGRANKSSNLLIFEELEDIYLSDQSIEDFAIKSLGNIENIRRLVTKISDSGKTIYSYGATAKGNTLLNAAKLDWRSIAACVDSTVIKQGKLLPGSMIPIISEEEAFGDWPDFFLLTAWNYREEIISKVRRSGNFHTRFIVPFPNVHVN